MDFLTILGLIMGAGVSVFVMAHQNILQFMWNLDALILVLGGTIAATLISFPWSEVKFAPSAIKVIFFPPRREHFVKLIARLINYSGLARKEGMARLSDELPKMKDSFMRSAFTLSLSGMEPDIVRESLERKVLAMRQRHQKTASIFRAMGTFAPIFGLLGTLIGVVTVLQAMGEEQAMEELGKRMSIAVTTTFYGIFGANFLFLPTAIKLNEYSDMEILSKELIIETVYSIQKEEFPIVLGKKLDSYVSRTLKERERKTG